MTTRFDQSQGELIGRDRERSTLGRIVTGLADGQGSALLIEGTPGVGKSALLAAIDPNGLPVVRVTGVETETGLPLSGLREMLAEISEEPLGPSQDLDPAVYLRRVAELLAEAPPLLILVDDLQWLDPSSRDAIAYLARRAPRLGIGLVAAWSLRGEPADAWPGVPAMRLEELDTGHALALASRSGLTDPVAEALVEAVGGNPLAIVEAPAELTTAQRNGQAMLPDPMPAGDRLRRAYADRIEGLPAPASKALLLAAAGAPGSLVASDLGPAEDAGLVRLGGDGSGIEFSHPLVRSAAYHSAPPSERRGAHRLIATESDEPERSWQLSLAAESPDEGLAASLERIGEAAGRRGAPATGAAVLERSARLTPGAEAAAARSIAAAAMALVAGQPARARGLLDSLLPKIEDPGRRAEIQLLRGIAIYQSGRPHEACALLETEADAIAPADPGRASALLTQACVALMGPGPMSRVAELAERARELAPEGAELIPSVIGAEVLVALGHHDRARELLNEHEAALRHWDPTAPGHEILAIAGLCRLWLGDHDLALTGLTRLIEADRAAGADSVLAAPLAVMATLHLRRGDLAQARENAIEAAEIADTGMGGFGLTLSLAAEAMVAAHLGDGETCERAAAKLLEIGGRLELTSSLAAAEQALGQLALGRGDMTGATVHLKLALDYTRAHGTLDPGFLFTHADLIEALVHAGNPEDAGPVLAELRAGAELTGSGWSRAAVERCLGLLGPDDELDSRLAAALEWHRHPPMPFEAARTRLAIGERMRRARRRSDARIQLEEARRAFAGMGATGWAARAARELAATGGSGAVGAAGEAPADELTSRERDVCRLVAGGSTNREVASALFLSPRTVEHHLRMAYRKLGVRSRTELAAHWPAGEA